MSLHIGIVACSAEGAALCYKTICVEGARFLGPHAHPEVSLHTHSLADYVRCLERGDLGLNLRREVRQVHELGDPWLAHAKAPRELADTTYEMMGEYRDELVRTRAGWRSRHRTLRLHAELGSRAVLRPA